MDIEKGAVIVGATVVTVLFAASCSSDAPRAEGSRTGSPTQSAPSSVPQIRPVDQVATGQVEPRVFAGQGAIITANTDGVASIDPRTLRVRWKVDLPAYGAAAGLDSVWVTDLEGKLVRRLDLLTGAVQAEIPVPGGPIGIIVHRGQVWVGGHRDGTVSRIDPRTNKVVSVTRVGPAESGGPFDLAASGDQVYVVVNNSNSVVRLDARSAEVTRRVTLPDGLYACGAVTLDGPIVWVTSCLESYRVARVDMRSGRVTGSESVRVFLGGGVRRGDVIWFSGRPGLSGRGAAFVGLDRTTAKLVGRLEVDDTIDGSVAAFGSWWVAQQDGVARFRLEDLVVGP